MAILEESCEAIAVRTLDNLTSRNDLSREFPVRSCWSFLSRAESAVVVAADAKDSEGFKTERPRLQPGVSLVARNIIKNEP